MYYYCQLKVCYQSLPGITSSQKSTELTTKLIRTMLIQNIEHSYIVVLRKYKNFVCFFSHETRNISLVRLCKFDYAVNLYPSLGWGEEIG